MEIIKFFEFKGHRGVIAKFHIDNAIFLFNYYGPTIDLPDKLQFFLSGIDYDPAEPLSSELVDQNKDLSRFFELREKSSYDCLDVDDKSKIIFNDEIYNLYAVDDNLENGKFSLIGYQKNEYARKYQALKKFSYPLDVMHTYFGENKEKIKSIFEN